MDRGKREISPSKQIAYTAILCALLIGGQYVFSFVAGGEVVTVILACFAYVAGVKPGVMCAVSFSLLRCFIFGFYPNVIILYLIYYPAFAATFGFMGKSGDASEAFFAVAVNVFLIAVAALCFTAYFTGAIAVSRILKATLNAFLWVIFALSVALLTAFDALLFAKKRTVKTTSAALKLIAYATVAAVFTVIFTLLDDVITPLVSGYGQGAWDAYFYGSFAAMLPQTVCAIVTVTTLFLPLTGLFNRFFSPRDTKNKLKR